MIYFFIDCYLQYYNKRQQGFAPILGIIIFTFVASGIFITARQLQIRGIADLRNFARVINDNGSTGIGASLKPAKPIIIEKGEENPDDPCAGLSGIYLAYCQGGDAAIGLPTKAPTLDSDPLPTVATTIVPLPTVSTVAPTPKPAVIFCPGADGKNTISEGNVAIGGAKDPVSGTVRRQCVNKGELAHGRRVQIVRLQ